MASSASPAGRTVLLTGATGFVGRAAFAGLERAGWTVRCAARDAARAAARWPERHWVALDVADAEATARALDGCEAALYLVHGMSAHAGDFRRQELDQARTFAKAADRAGLRRIVYLGGVVAADADASEHLRSRQEVGEELRAGPVSAIELRASMIIGHGSLSWLIVRDLAARLPIMVLPRWLESRTQPVAIADVTVALERSLDLVVDGSAWFDVPGPETLSGRTILERTAAVLGARKPVMIEVPFLSPRLSSHWVRFVTRAEWSVAREVVLGLKTDLLAHDDRFWTLIGHTQLLTFDEAARKAVADEQADGPVPGVWGIVERMLTRAPRKNRT
ncbi:MAG: NAD(P)H-binding protein [Acidobacteriota bacterium]